MGTVLQVGHSMFSKIIIIFGFIMFLIAMIILVPEWYLQSNYKLLLVLGLPNLIFLVILPISLIRYRITIDDLFVEFRDIRTRRIYFADIKSLRLDEGSVILKSENTSIEIGGSTSNRKQVNEEIFSRVRKLPNVHIHGDKKEIEKYFGGRKSQG